VISGSRSPLFGFLVFVILGLTALSVQAEGIAKEFVVPGAGSEPYYIALGPDG